MRFDYKLLISLCALGAFASWRELFLRYINSPANYFYLLSSDVYESRFWTHLYAGRIILPPEMISSIR